MCKENNKLICQICGKEFKNWYALGTHIAQFEKIKTKDYYDLYLKKNKDEHLCIICNINICSFISLHQGYKSTCSTKCGAQISKLKIDYQKRNLKMKQTKLKKYGDENYCNPTQIKKTKLEKYGDENYCNLEKIKETTLKNFNVEWSFQSENNKNKSKKTRFEKYGDENFNNRALSKKTCLEKYGVANPAQSIVIQEKTKQTNLDRYNVDHNSKRPEVIQKRLNTWNNKTTEEKLEIKLKRNLTNLERWGCEETFSCLELIEKRKQTCLEKYGVPYVGLNINNVSKSSQKFCKELHILIDNEIKDVYYADNKGEMWIRNKFNKFYFYDFCIPSLKKIIEYNGDYWHRNPKFYEATEENIEIWKKDEFKKQVAEEHGFQILYIWESDYKNDPDFILQKCLNFIIFN